MSLFSGLFGKKPNRVINEPKTRASTSTFYYGGSHVAYDHREDYNTRDFYPPLNPWSNNDEVINQQTTIEPDAQQFGGFGGGDGGGAGAGGSIDDYSSGNTESYDSGSSNSSND